MSPACPATPPAPAASSPSSPRRAAAASLASVPVTPPTRLKAVAVHDPEERPLIKVDVEKYIGDMERTYNIISKQVNKIISGLVFLLSVFFRNKPEVKYDINEHDFFRKIAAE